LISGGKTLTPEFRSTLSQAAAANHILMRKTLFAAVALAPLLLMAVSAPASAQTTIGNSTSTPVNTAADGDISITSGGSITPTTPNTAAVTVNSSNNVNNGGTISYKDVNNATGILLLGGNGSSADSLSIQNTGSITITESYTPSDANKDGVNEAPFASITSTGRYGIRLTGTQPFYGFVSNAGAITIQGDQSAGISLEAPLQGILSNSGSIAVTGDNSVGLQETAGVSGGVAVTGTITTAGKNTSAMILSGDVGGTVSVYSALSATGYGSTTRTTNATLLNTIQSTPSEVEQGGPTAIISGNVGGGIFLGAPPSTTNSSDTTTDADGDGIVDSSETTSSITAYGTGPALIVGGVNNITIGGFTATSASNPNNGMGLIIEGTVEAFGVYDGVTATALQIGGLGGTTTIDGGVRITGTVEASAYGSDAMAIHVGSGATIPTIENTGTIEASIAPPNTTSSTYPAFTATATAIQIDAGSKVSALVNSGTIIASISGDSGDQIAVNGVIDHGGGISSVTNTGQILTQFTADATGATPTGKSVALDLSANTTGVTLTQDQAPNQIVTTTVSNGTTTVTTTTGAVVYPTTPATTGGSLYPTTATSTTTTPSSGVTVVTTTPASPTIEGDIYLGSGSNTVNLLAGTITGALNLGSGPTAAFTIDNGAIYAGALSYTGPALSLNIKNGILDNSNAATFNASSINVGASGTLYFGVDPVNNKATEFIVSGSTTIASGAKIGLTFVSNATGPQTYTILTSPSLTVGGDPTTLSGPVPYMFNATITPNTTAGTIALTISPKTAAQLGLNPSQSAALPAVYQALTLDQPVQAVFLGQYTRAGFDAALNQIMPDYAGGTFQAANAASLAISRATAEANNIENPTGSRGAWVQELFIGVNQGTGQTDGFRGGGFGFVGGLETGGSGLGAFGVTTAFVSTSIADPHVPGDSQTSLSELELGGYWQGEFSGFVADARLGAGYTWDAGTREFIETDSSGDITLDRKLKSNWNGYTLSGHFGLAYDWQLGSRFFGGGWFMQPQAHIDYFRLQESRYSDNEAQGGPALALAYDGRTGQETSGTASIVFGRKLGTGLVWRPQVELGVRDVFSGDAGDTTARFISGGPSFTLTPADITGLAGVGRFKLKASSEYYELGFEAGGEILSSRYQEGDVKMSVRVLF